MKVLIIALPRTGSTSLLYQIAKDRGLKAFFEPFMLKDTYYFNLQMENIVVKTVIEQYSDNYNLAKQFDEVILLSRKNHKDHVESLAYFYHNAPDNYDSNDIYEYKTPPTHIHKKANRRILEMNADLKVLSDQLNIPIQYYEDFFDKDSGDRLRIKEDINKSFI